MILIIKKFALKQEFTTNMVFFNKNTNNYFTQGEFELNNKKSGLIFLPSVDIKK